MDRQRFRRLAGVVLAVVTSTLTTVALAQSADDHLRICGNSGRACDASRTEFRQDFSKALRGDYQGQRNVAYCLSRGCDDAVQVSGVGGCAWRILIVGSGSSKVTDGDTANLRAECSKLDALDRASAIAQAKQLMLKIYKRPLP